MKVQMQCEKLAEENIKLVCISYFKMQQITSTGIVTARLRFGVIKQQCLCHLGATSNYRRIVTSFNEMLYDFYLYLVASNSS